MENIQNKLYQLSKKAINGKEDYIIMNIIKNIFDKQLKKNKNQKKFLLISSVGKNSIHKECKWGNILNKDDLNYDSLFIYYDNDYISNECEFSLHFTGKKMIQYYYVFLQKKFIDNYKYIFILDNDNWITGKQISTLFKIADKLNANLLSPSIRIRNIDHSKVKKLMNFYYNSNIINKDFWFFKKYLPDDLKLVYDHVIKYSFWPQMIQMRNLEDKFIKQTNLVEDGRYIINMNLIKKFRSNKPFMKLFKSGILFDNVLANYSNFKKIYIVDFIYYIHLSPYKDKDNEHKEAKIIKKYIKKKFNNFVFFYPKKIKEKYFILEKKL